MTRQHFQHLNASNRIIFRAKILNKGNPMIALTRNISDLGGIVSAIDVVRPAIDGIIRDFSIDTEGVDYIQAILEAMQSQPWVEWSRHSESSGASVNVRFKTAVYRHWEKRCEMAHPPLAYDLGSTTLPWP